VRSEGFLPQVPALSSEIDPAAIVLTAVALSYPAPGREPGLLYPRMTFCSLLSLCFKGPAAAGMKGTPSGEEGQDCMICCQPLAGGEGLRGLCGGPEECGAFVYCGGCAEKYFRGLVEQSHVSCCPPMRCPACPRLVPFEVWTQHVAEVGG
jgi:hypothetical protein